MPERHNAATARRIAVVVQKYGLVGGGEKFVYELTERLARNPRWEMHVFANQWRQGSEAVRFHHVPIIGFPRFLKPLSFAHFANRKIRAASMDLIHTHERIFEADLLTAHGIPHATWVRDIRRKKPSLFDRAASAIEQRLITSDRCRRIMAVSSIVEEKMLAAFPGIDDKIQIIHPGVDTVPYDQLDRQVCRTQIRARFGIPENHHLLLFVGMNFEVKRLDAIIASLANLKKIAPNMPLALLVVGKGDIKHYREMAQRNGIAKEIIFAGVWKENIAPIYMAADLFIMLSAFDTFGIAVIEAMAAGLPVIISPNVGAKDVVSNGKTGYIVEPNHPEDVGKCISLSLMPQRYSRMSLKAQAAIKSLTWTTIAEQVGQQYEALLAR